MSTDTSMHIRTISSSLQHYFAHTVCLLSLDPYHTHVNADFVHTHIIHMFRFLMLAYDFPIFVYDFIVNRWVFSNGFDLNVDCHLPYQSQRGWQINLKSAQKRLSTHCFHFWGKTHKITYITIKHAEKKYRFTTLCFFSLTSLFTVGMTCSPSI